MNELPLSRCSNCETPLVGPHCHICGQHAHNPLRSFAHAVEDVFESLWHLDGRIFRTLRDLCVPGRLAANFLDGRRAAYLPPLRLFVILSLLTFFIGKLTLHIEIAPTPQVTPGATAAAAAARATTRATTTATTWPCTPSAASPDPCPPAAAEHPPAAGSTPYPLLRSSHRERSCAGYAVMPGQRSSAIR